MDNEAHAQPHEVVHLPHPLAVAAGKIVVDGDDMNALPGQGVEIGREHGHKGLALAGLHLGDAPLMKDDAADQLDPEGLHSQHAPGCLPHSGKGFWQDLVQALPLRQAFFEFPGLGAQRLIAQRGILPVQLFYGVGYGVYSFQFSV